MRLSESPRTGRCHLKKLLTQRQGVEAEKAEDGTECPHLREGKREDDSILKGNSGEFTEHAPSEPVLLQGGWASRAANTAALLCVQGPNTGAAHKQLQLS